MLFRPPYGARNDAILQVVQADKLKSMEWNIDSMDWADPVPNSVAQRVLAEIASFLNLPGQLDASAFDVRYDKRYREMWASMNRGLRGPYARYIVRRFDDQARDFGYSMADLDSLEENALKISMG